MTTLLFSHLNCLDHQTGEFHPESAERLKAITHLLEHEDFAYLPRESAPAATVAQLTRAHSARHVEDVLAPMPKGSQPRFIDADTVISPGSAEAALRSVGAACAAVDAVAAKECRNAFCSVRPPGHHAERDRAMGFCLFNNVAVAALHARAAHGFERVAVVDFDAHHGNGIQQIFWDQPGTFYASTHQDDAFPYTGTAAETGAPGGGVIVNAPMPKGSGGDVFRAAYDDLILPRLRAFAPDFLLIAAGFDAHAADPLSYLRLKVDDFTWITRRLLDLAGEVCGNRVVSVLEGGYDTRTLGACVAAHVRLLMGH